MQCLSLISLIIVMCTFCPSHTADINAKLNLIRSLHNSTLTVDREALDFNINLFDYSEFIERERTPQQKAALDEELRLLNISMSTSRNNSKRHDYTGDNSKNVGNANALIDEILANAKPDLAKRINVPDINDGDFKLWDISVWGFESLKRGGNVCFENKGSSLQTVRANFQVFNIRVSAHGSYKLVVKVFNRIKIGQNTFKGKLDAIIPHVKVRFEIDINHNERRIKLKEFEFEKFDNARIKVKLRGILKIFNFFASYLADRKGNKNLRSKANTMLRNAFSKALAKFNKFDLIPQ